MGFIDRNAYSHAVKLQGFIFLLRQEQISRNNHKIYIGDYLIGPWYLSADDKLRNTDQQRQTERMGVWLRCLNLLFTSYKLMNTRILIYEFIIFQAFLLKRKNSTGTQLSKKKKGGAYLCNWKGQGSCYNLMDLSLQNSLLVLISNFFSFLTAFWPTAGRTFSYDRADDGSGSHSYNEHLSSFYYWFF